jgi:hypothetical protein
MYEVKLGHSILFQGKNYLGGEKLPAEFDKYADDFKTKLIHHNDVIESDLEVAEEAPKKRGRAKKAK